MSTSPQALEEIKKSAGMSYPPLVYEIEKGMIEHFAQAIGDSNPQWQVNKNQLIAPPTFPLILGFDHMIQNLNRDSSLTILHGSTELEYLQPIVSGDTLTTEMSITNIREREGKTGTMLFVTFEIKCRNQRQEPVATCRQLAIIY